MSAELRLSRHGKESKKWQDKAKRRENPVLSGDSSNQR